MICCTDNYPGIYLHIPFCNSKCPYCDFYSTASNKNKNEYVEALITHIKEWGSTTDVLFGTVYLGGGTPSVLENDQLERIFKTVNESFRFLDNTEITCEVNPESANREKIQTLVKCGVNRLSIGLQSSHQDELEILGRKHTALDVKKVVEEAKSFGINNISLDLMIGLPNQNKNKIKQSIDFCNQLGVNHISCYVLMIEENTVFGKKGVPGDLPDDEKTSELYLYAVEYLEKLGFEQYEVSNFARSGFYSRHNTNYWKVGEYLGIGASAHSFWQGKRFYYAGSIKMFIENNKPISDGVGGGVDEYIMLGLRLKDGISQKEMLSKYGKTFSSEQLEKIETFSNNGLCVFDGDRLYLTTNGFMVSNYVIGEII